MGATNILPPKINIPVNQMTHFRRFYAEESAQWIKWTLRVTPIYFVIHHIPLELTREMRFSAVVVIVGILMINDAKPKESLKDVASKLGSEGISSVATSILAGAKFLAAGIFLSPIVATVGSALVLSKKRE